ncbi:MAG: bifunctional phosphoribosyl-AMP cyclohydrolase/phosphoribosyl-ATP diphosphatase HisIE [Polyangia bacterium]
MTMTDSDVSKLDWEKGLLPAVIQDHSTRAVLMVGFMNEEALRRTLAGPHVVFFSRTKNRLWEKGETSGHFFDVVRVTADCDRDTILVEARSHGPACHTGATTCFGEPPPADFLAQLADIIDSRIAEAGEKSYTTRLWAEGQRRIAQKVGEEGLEVALAAVCQDEAAVVSESADLVFHLLVLLKSRGLGLPDVVAELARRHAAKS